MFLATTALAEFWNPSDELVFLGPWCAHWDRRPDWQGLTYRWAPNPWEDRAAFGAAYAYCDQASERLLERLAAFLNEAHGTSFSTRYWRIVLGLWLPYHVQQLYDHYVHLRMVLAAWPEIETISLDREDWRTPADGLEFLEWAQADAYHLQLYSFLLEALRPGLAKRRLSAPLERRIQPSAMLSRAGRGSMRLLRRLGFGRVLGAEWRFLAMIGCPPRKPTPRSRSRGYGVTGPRRTPASGRGPGRKGPRPRRAGRATSKGRNLAILSRPRKKSRPCP